MSGKAAQKGCSVFISAGDRAMMPVGVLEGRSAEQNIEGKGS